MDSRRFRGRELAATLGREFSYKLIRAVWPLDEVALQKGLAAMVEAELLYQSGVVSQAKYYFKHSLIQEAAYQSVLTTRAAAIPSAESLELWRNSFPSLQRPSLSCWRVTAWRPT